MPDIDRKKLIERIRKLLALGQSTNIHEAELAMAKVNELLTEHQLAFSDILTKEAKATGVKDGKFHHESEVYRSFMWQIGKAAAVLFDADVLIGRKGAFFFIGLPEDIIQAEHMYYYLRDAWKAINSADTKLWKDTLGYSPSQYEVKRYKAGHGQGFSETIINRARVLAYKRKAEVKAATGNALVIVKDQLLKERLKGIKIMRDIKEEYLGYEDGVIRGKAIPLAGAIKSSTDRLGVK